MQEQQEEDLGFISEEALEELQATKGQQEEVQEESPLAPQQWKTLSADNIGDFFNQYDKLRALGYVRADHFSSQLIQSSRVGFWKSEMVLDPAKIDLETLETMSWGAMKALGTELEVESNNRKGMTYGICTKLGINPQTL